jgi:hypothetical protein
MPAGARCRGNDSGFHLYFGDTPGGISFDFSHLLFPPDETPPDAEHLTGLIRTEQ